MAIQLALHPSEKISLIKLFRASVFSMRPINMEPSCKMALAKVARIFRCQLILLLIESREVKEPRLPAPWSFMNREKFIKFFLI